MTFAASALLALALQGMGTESEADDDKDAKALLTRIEEKFAKAKSIKAKGKLEIKGRESFTIESEASFKGDKFALSHVGRRDKEEKRTTMVCDGTDLVITKGDATNRVAGKDQASGLVTAFSRAGLVSLFIYGELAGKPDVAIKDFFTVTDLKLGKDEKVGERTCKVLTYTLEMKGDKDKPAVTLWLDAETLAPVKRHIKGNRDDDEGTETWSEFAFDGDIKDDAFVVPKK